MIEERAEDVLKAYVVATQQASGAALNGVTIYPGHAVDAIPESQTGAGWAVVACEGQGGELADVGIPTVRVRWILRAPATTAGKASLRAWSQAIINTFALSQIETLVTWIAAQATTNVRLNALRFVDTVRGSVPGREQVGREVRFDAEFYIPGDD